MKNKEPVQYRAAGGVRYEFKRKRVKNINLRVRADGSVAVSAPLGAPLAQVDAFVAGRARWIEAARVRALARGEEEQRPCSVSREDALALFTQVSDAVFPLFAQVLNGQRPVLKVRQMKTRWGSCTPARGTIRFNTLLFEADAECIDAVVLHELTHLIHQYRHLLLKILHIQMPKAVGTAAYILKRKNGALFAVLVLPAQGRGFKMAGYMIYYYS